MGIQRPYIQIYEMECAYVVGLSMISDGATKTHRVQ